MNEPMNEPMNVADVGHVAVVEGVKVVCNRNVRPEGPGGLAAYVTWAKERFGEDVEELALEFDGEFVNVSARHAEHEPFERIRRITGYLVGTLDRFNDAKRAEVSDRVAHAVPEADARGAKWLEQRDRNREAASGMERPAGVSHGSADEDEMRARMRDAGWEDWEIEEEIADRHAAFDLAKGGRSYDPTKIVAERMTLGSSAAGALVGSLCERKVPMRGNAAPGDPASQEAQSRSAAAAGLAKEAQDARKARR